MSLFLSTSAHEDRTSYDHRRTVGPSTSADGADTLLAHELKAAYGRIADEWFALASRMSADASAILAHTPSCAANVSDMGLMFAWTDLAKRWNEGTERVLLICDDPWLFRHLKESIAGITVVSPPPPLWRKSIAMTVRGYLARLTVTARVVSAWISAIGERRHFPTGSPAILSYVHPASTADGMDAYFGPLMRKVPDLARVLHVDFHGDGGKKLVADGRTCRLHAWGSLHKALTLPFARWRPSPAVRRGPYRWLIRRAATLEGGTGQAAAIRWQQTCQDAWLRSACPRVVAWPWENHGWERALVRSARRLGVRTVGSQHATVGKYEWNYSPGSYAQETDDSPDSIVCVGPASAAHLVALGYRKAQVVVGGMLRGATDSTVFHDPDGPVFVALPLNDAIARQMIAAIEALANVGWHFVVKPHPMARCNLATSQNLRMTATPFSGQGGLSAVIYSATTVGLEAVFAGLPVVEFLPTGLVANDIIPDGIEVVSADTESLGQALNGLKPPAPVDREHFFAEPQWQTWRQIFELSC